MHTWLVTPEDLPRLLHFLARTAQALFNTSDWDAITLGLRDAEPALGYDYALYGDRTIHLQLTPTSPGAITVHAHSDPETETILAVLPAASDRELIRQVYAAFTGAPRPEHFTNHLHCPECEGHDSLLRSRTWDTLTLHDVRYTWSPLGFLTPEGWRYWLPALIRLSLTDPEPGYLGELLRQLETWEAKWKPVLTASEHAALQNFFHHLREWRPELLRSAPARSSLWEGPRLARPSLLQSQHPDRLRLEALLRPEYHLPGERIASASPTGRFRLVAEAFLREDPDFAGVCEIWVTDSATDERIARLLRDDERFWHGWVERNGEEYLLFSEMLEGGQTVVNLTERTLASFFPEGEEFIWAEFFPSPSGDRLAIVGCYWACPFMVVIYDFRNPMQLPLPRLAEIMFEEDEHTCAWLSESELQLKDQHGNPGRTIAVP